MRITQTDWARFVLDPRYRWWSLAALLALAALAGVLGGWLVTTVGAYGPRRARAGHRMPDCGL